MAPECAPLTRDGELTRPSLANASRSGSAPRQLLRSPLPGVDGAVPAQELTRLLQAEPVDQGDDQRGRLGRVEVGAGPAHVGAEEARMERDRR